MVCWRAIADGIVLSVRVTPRAGRDAVDGVLALADGREYALVRVRTAPDKGVANETVIAVLARAFGVPKSAVAILSGHTARLKQVRIAGPPDRLAAIAGGWSRAAG